MEINELLNILTSGEGTTIEYKEAQGGVPLSVYETVVSFSNTDGGVIVLGADNDGVVLGIPNSLQNTYISNIVSSLNNQDNISPPLYLHPSVVKHPEGDVIVIRVPASSVIHKYASKIFWRNHDNDQDITNNQQKISDIYFRKRNYFTENNIYPFLRIEDLDLELFQKAKSIISNTNATHPWLSMSAEQILRSSTLFYNDFYSGKKGLTLAAALIFGKDVTISNILPAYKLDAIVRKIDNDRYDDRLVLRTNLIDTYLQLINFVKKHLDEKFYQDGIQRKDLRELIFREVIANVIVHREYTNAMSSEFIIYKDKVVVKNPNKALFYGSIDLDSFNPCPKNPMIRKFFNILGWADELGSGIRNTNKYLKIYVPGAKPLFLENDTFVTEIPLLHISMAIFYNKIAKWLNLNDEIRDILKHNLNDISLKTKMNNATWEEVLLNLVLSWNLNGTKFKNLDWPKNQPITENEIKKVLSWQENDTKIIHKKSGYLIRILFLSIKPVALEQLMLWLHYSNKNSFRKNYLQPLLNEGFIKMTKPDAIKAPDQKYVITEKGKQFLNGTIII